MSGISSTAAGATRPHRPARARSSVAQYAAIALFIWCAQASQLDFRLTSANAQPSPPSVCASTGCRALIRRTAAARSNISRPRRPAGAPSADLALKPAGRDLPLRQRTIVARSPWSYDLLTGAEQILLMTQRVFIRRHHAGGCRSHVMRMTTWHSTCWMGWECPSARA